MRFLNIELSEYPDLPNAACAEQDPELWFSTNHHGQGLAARVCRRCPEIRDCLLWALTHDERGIWAGTTEEQRADLRRRHQQQGATA